MDRNEKRSLSVVIDNVTEAQAIAIEDMLRAWVQFGSMGSSRWTAFFADGDGNFHPHITIDGREPRYTDLVSQKQRWGKCQSPGEMYWMDFDWIAWGLRARDEGTLESGKAVAAIDPVDGISAS